MIDDHLFRGKVPSSLWYCNTPHKFNQNFLTASTEATCTEYQVSPSHRFWRLTHLCTSPHIIVVIPKNSINYTEKSVITSVTSKVELADHPQKGPKNYPLTMKYSTSSQKFSSSPKLGASVRCSASVSSLSFYLAFIVLLSPDSSFYQLMGMGNQISASSSLFVAGESASSATSSEANNPVECTPLGEMIASRFNRGKWTSSSWLSLLMKDIRHWRGHLGTNWMTKERKRTVMANFSRGHQFGATLYLFAQSIQHQNQQKFTGKISTNSSNSSRRKRK